MKKILPITTEIPIKTYNNIAYPLSVIFSNYAHPEDWLLLNAFSLKYGTEANDVTLNLPENMNWKCFDKKVISFVDTTIGNIINEVLNNRYVYIAVDEMFIPFRKKYQKRNFVHDILVYGFDDVCQEFYVIGFDKSKKYSCQKIDFSILQEAILSASVFLSNTQSTYEYFGAGNNYSFKLGNLNICNTTIDLSALQTLVKKDINGSVFYSSHGSLCYSGLPIYKKLIEDEAALLDYRNWSIIKERNMFIFQIISNYWNTPNIEHRITELNNTILSCLNLSLKFYYDKKNSTLQNLKYSTENVYRLTAAIFNDFLNNSNSD